MASPSAAQDFGSIIDSVGSLFGGTDVVRGSSSGTASSITDAFSSFDKRTSGITEETTGKKDISAGITKDKLKLDPAAINKIIRDVLSGSDGLASIFAGEQTAGIFDSSVAAQAAGDLATKLVGELAKLTAERQTVTGEVGGEFGTTDVSTFERAVGEQEQTQATQQQQETTSRQESEDKGIISDIGDFFGF